jgi:glycine/D-amino acid oxidase-like deaminating enzyme
MQAAHADPEDFAATLGAVTEVLHDPGAYSVRAGACGYYADTADKRFHVEAVGRTLVVTGCSGRMFKFGALIGQWAAAWAQGDILAERLRRRARG